MEIEMEIFPYMDLMYLKSDKTKFMIYDNVNDLFDERFE